MSELCFANLLTMLNVNKSRSKDKYLAAVFRKGFCGYLMLVLHRGESGASGGCWNNCRSHSAIFTTIEVPCFWALSRKRDGLP